LFYVEEGMNSSIAVTRALDTHARSFHVCGKVEASSRPEDMRIQRMLGHLPAIVHPNPKTVLVVGCGAGVTSGSLLTYPSIDRIVICEIEELIPPMAEKFFGEENNHVAGRALDPDKWKDGPKVEIVHDDARHYILTTNEKFDIITSDPIHPWVKGTATLYSTEYFKLVQQHLNPGGVATQWVPLYESHLDAVKSQIATFMDVFPNGTIWSNDIKGYGYDVVLVARDGDVQINVDQLKARLNQENYAGVRKSLHEVGLLQIPALLGSYAGQGPDLTEWLKGAQINTDRNLRLQYLAGMGLNTQRGNPILHDILAYRRFPENLFSGSPLQQQALRSQLEVAR
jgi:spermidine synthase